jgi:hypothetical protein
VLEPVGQLTQQRRAGKPDHPVAASGEFEPAGRVHSLHPQGAIQGVIVNRALNWTRPITGGSGQYNRARGQVVSRDVSTPTQPQVELTFHLEN